MQGEPDLLGAVSSAFSAMIKKPKLFLLSISINFCDQDRAKASTNIDNRQPPETAVTASWKIRKMW